MKAHSNNDELYFILRYSAHHEQFMKAMKEFFCDIYTHRYAGIERELGLGGQVWQRMLAIQKDIEAVEAMVDQMKSDLAYAAGQKEAKQ